MGWGRLGASMARAAVGGDLQAGHRGSNLLKPLWLTAQQQQRRQQQQQRQQQRRRQRRRWQRLHAMHFVTMPSPVIAHHHTHSMASSVVSSVSSAAEIGRHSSADACDRARCAWPLHWPPVELARWRRTSASSAVRSTPDLQPGKARVRRAQTAWQAVIHPHPTRAQLRPATHCCGSRRAAKYLV